MKIIKRKYQEDILKLCSYFPIVAVIGARQVGKTTLVKIISQLVNKETIYLDLELVSDINKLDNAELFFKINRDKCIIIDEIQLRPDLFPLLRAVVDIGEINCQFVITGSASPKLLKQSTESLAGRIAFVELQPFSIDELPEGISVQRHWFRGGFPKALFAINDDISYSWLENFVKAYVERDLQMLGISAEPLFLRRFWTMLAYMHGNVVNYSTIANSLGVTVKTVKRYVDFFEQAYLIRRVSPFFSNAKKRLIKTPKVFLSDTGILHYLLGIKDVEMLYGNPHLGNSWEGYCVNQIVNMVKNKYDVFYYRTKDGAECDLVLTKGYSVKTAIEIKFSSAPKLTKGNTEAFKAIGAEKNYVVIPQEDNYPLRDDVEVIGIQGFISTLNVD